jgi:hypothetical protein
MKRFAKLALGAALLAGTAFAVATPASARVSIGIGVGVPGPGYYGPAYGPPPGAVCDPYSRWYDPYTCDQYYGADYDDYYYGPSLFYDGFWYSGPLRSRYYGGQRQFYVGGGWHGVPGYHGGGSFRSGGASYHGDGGYHGGGSYHGGGGGGGGHHH